MDDRKGTKKFQVGGFQEWGKSLGGNKVRGAAFQVSLLGIANEAKAKTQRSRLPVYLIQGKRGYSERLAIKKGYDQGTPSRPDLPCCLQREKSYIRVSTVYDSDKVDHYGESSQDPWAIGGGTTVTQLAVGYRE